MRLRRLDSILPNTSADVPAAECTANQAPMPHFAKLSSYQNNLRSSRSFSRLYEHSAVGPKAIDTLVFFVPTKQRGDLLQLREQTKKQNLQRILARKLFFKNSTDIFFAVGRLRVSTHHFWWSSSATCRSKHIHHAKHCAGVISSPMT